MATFKFGRAIDLHWNGYDIQGPAETVFSIPDQLYEEFDADIAPVEPTLVWIDTNEFSTLQNSVVTSTIIGSSYISVASTTAGTQLSLKSGAATNGYVLTADGAGGQAYQAAPGGSGALSAVIGTSPLSVITSAGTATVSIDSSIITAENATRIRTYVRNTTASTITKGSVVYLTGSNGTVPSVENALANSDATSSRTFGIVEADIPTNSNGYVTNQGLLSPLSTTGVADGAVLWLSHTIAGAFTTTKPTGPSHGVLVGIVVKGTSAGAGSIYVLIKNGSELDEIHDVNITSPVTGQSIIWSSTASVWQNALIGSASISASAVTSGHISTGAVGSAALAANAVVAAAISAGAVGTAALATGAVTDIKIAANAVTSGHILAGAVGTAALATGAVTSIKIAAGAVDTAALGTGAVISAKIAAGAVDTAALGTASVISAKIAASAVTSGHIAAGAIGTSALATGAVTSAAIAASAVTSGHIAAGAIGTAALATGAVTSIKIAAGAVDTAALGTDAVISSKIAASAITSGHISAASVGTAAISSGAATSGQLLQANGSGAAIFATVPTGATVSISEFTATGTWTKPAGASAVYVWLLGAGGGGQGGNREIAANTAASGAAGAGGGQNSRIFNASILPSTVTVTIGAGGAGGIGLSATTTTGTGTQASAGGFTYFGVAGSEFLATGGGAGGKTGLVSYGVPPISPAYWLSNPSGTFDAAQDFETYKDNDLYSMGALGGVSGSVSSTTIAAALATSSSPGFKGYGLFNGAIVGSAATVAGGAGGSATAGFGTGGGGGGSNNTLSGLNSGNGGAGGNGRLGGGGGGGGSVWAASGTARNTGTGGTGGNGYALVISW